MKAKNLKTAVQGLHLLSLCTAHLIFHVTQVSLCALMIEDDERVKGTPYYCITGYLYVCDSEIICAIWPKKGSNVCGLYLCAALYVGCGYPYHRYKLYKLYFCDFSFTRIIKYHVRINKRSYGIATRIFTYTCWRFSLFLFSWFACNNYSKVETH